MFLHSTRSLTDQIEKYTQTHVHQTQTRQLETKLSQIKDKSKAEQEQTTNRRGIKSVSTTDEERKSGSTTDQAIQSVHFADGDRVEQASSIVALSPSFRRLRT